MRFVDQEPQHHLDTSQQCNLGPLLSSNDSDNWGLGEGEGKGRMTKSENDMRNMSPRWEACLGERLSENRILN